MRSITTLDEPTRKNARKGRVCALLAHANDLRGDRRLASELGSFIALRVLVLSSNALAALPGTLPATLEYLDVSCNDIAHIDEDSALVGLTSLRVLKLSRNPLARLPDSMGALASLRALEVRGLYSTAMGNGEALRGALTTVPDSLASLPLLASLVLPCNRLSRLPDAVLRCTALERLNLSCNGLKALPALNRLARLRDLNVACNDLRSLPTQLARLPRLRALRVRDNPLAKQLKHASELGTAALLRALDPSASDSSSSPSTC